MKKQTRRLALHRETLRHLQAGAVTANAIGPVQDTQQLECYSPLCGPTYWKTCETNTALA
jgi:hypothetical protein